MAQVAQAPPTDRRPFTVDEVLRMGEAGIFGDEHVELLDGELCTVSPQGPAHRTLVVELRRRLEAALGQAAHVQDHSGVRLGDRSLPEPDLAVVRGAPRAYLERLPTGADLLLVVEVAVTSRGRDRRKAATYARGHVPVYWLLDVPARTLTVHTDPDPATGRYAHHETLAADATVAVPGSDARWPVASMLP